MAAITALWIELLGALFGLIIGVALAIDLGVIGKIRHMLLTKGKERFKTLQETTTMFQIISCSD
jgi:hypothetical protein